ncbi:MAG: site-specific recombinase [Chromatiales bacterium]|jgi:site-specific recombinase|nr:site-specific recombinase [Chromatiales bacterium]MDX9766921.1 site-specific recombinase [Ectothiorhodospiraceae bacterium]
MNDGATAAALLAVLEADDGRDPADTLRLIVDWLRPADVRRGIAAVVARIEGLALALEERPLLRQRLQERLSSGLAGRHLTLYTETGLFSRRGFMREFVDRFYERLNPRPLERDNLKDLLAYVFHRSRDAFWVAALPNDAWWRLLEGLGCLAEASPKIATRAREEILYALEMLAVWVAAEELEPEFLRLDPAIAMHDSAFVALQRELSRYVEDYRAWVGDPAAAFHDDRHARVLLEQCREQIERFRKRAVTHGSSISLTHLLERLTQTLTRIGRLLDVLDPADDGARRAAVMDLFRELVLANARRNSLGSLWQESVGLLARGITQQASETGEHYITADRSEYLRMFRSGAGAGCIIAFMALIKLQIGDLDLTPGWNALWVSLNYGLGFVLIHILHFTVATKQPAMTAATLAAAIEETEKGTANPARLADLLIQVGRSQFVAVLGNVSVALPVAMLVGVLHSHLLEVPVMDAVHADHLLHKVTPFEGLALLHAAIAGVWLFVAGLISGFFDNRCAYLDLPGRLRGHPMLGWLSEPTRDRLADFIGHNYGALAGNFLFGVLLGSTAYLGYLMSLPLDIQHVAFGSANLGYVASTRLDGLPGLLPWLGFVLLIGAVNLWVSFALALYVALRARGTRIGAMDRLLRAYLSRLRERPLEFLLPPGRAADDVVRK